MGMWIEIVASKILRRVPFRCRLTVLWLLVFLSSDLLKQKVNESGMEDSSPLPPPVHSLQEKQPRPPRSEAPVDSMLKDMATIIFSTFLLAGWVAFIITYPKVKKKNKFLHFIWIYLRAVLQGFAHETG